MTNSTNRSFCVLDLTLQLGRSHRLLSASLVRDAGAVDLSFGQVVVLRALLRGGRVRQHELAKILATTKSNVVQLIDGLMELNLILREQDPSDRRANLISLTEKGRELADRIVSPTDRLTGTLCERLGERRVVEIMDWLRELDSSLT
jgi:MarR family transcriptional regulator for hemolysin